MCVCVFFSIERRISVYCCSTIIPIGTAAGGQEVFFSFTFLFFLRIYGRLESQHPFFPCCGEVEGEMSGVERKQGKEGGGDGGLWKIAS